MTDFMHSETCRRYAAAIAERRAAFLAAYPYFCRECSGLGSWSESFDPSPSGVSLGSGTMTDSGPCPACVEEGHCPYCGKASLVEEGDHCLNVQCGWIDGNPGFPEFQECDCYERWIETLEDEVHDTIFEG